MTYVAHRLLSLIVLTVAIVMTGCKSAQPETRTTDGQQVQIPTPEPQSQVAATDDLDTATLASPSVMVVVNADEVVSQAPASPQPLAMPQQPKVKPVPATPAESPSVQATPLPTPQRQVQVQPQVLAPVPLWSLKYPGTKEQFGGDLSMTVVQDKKSIKITNRTVESFKDVQVWINQRFVTRATNLPVGKTTAVPLKSFINQYGEKYPTPGLFRPDRSFPALLVEIYQLDQNKRYRLIVQKTHSQF